MYPRSILKFFTLSEIKEISLFLSKYYPLVEAERIFDLILQVDSLDTSLHILNVHKTSDLTLDFIIYSYLHFKDEEK